MAQPHLLPACPVALASNGAAPPDQWTAGIDRLQRMLQPSGFAPGRWAQIQTDCARLLDHHGAELHALGWAVTDAFGVHPDAPATAVRCYGLGLLLNGGSVVELTGSGAMVELLNRSRQRFTRAPGTGAVPVWDVAW